MTTPKQSEWELKPERVIDPADVTRKLLPAARLDPNPATWFMIYLTANVGARISEVLSLKAGDLNEADACLLVRTLKRRGPHVRQLYIQKEVVGEVRSWIVRNQLKDDDYLFPSPTRKGKPMTRQWAGILFNRAAMTAGIKRWGHNGRSGVGLHGLRHANAVALMQNARRDRSVGPLDALELIKKRLGHSSLKSTMVYLHVCNERDVVSRMPTMGTSSTPQALPKPTRTLRPVLSRVVEDSMRQGLPLAQGV